MKNETENTIGVARNLDRIFESLFELECQLKSEGISLDTPTPIAICIELIKEELRQAHEILESSHNSEGA